MSTTSSPADAAQQELSGLAGDLIGPNDAEYDDARVVFNAMIDRRPALIARCATPADVAQVIAFARAHDLPLAVRGGGHSGGGFGVVDDGVVCDLSLLKEIVVDPAARTVRVGGGCTWGEVDAATNEHGLAVPAGIISTTGVAGLTLGGGHGYLTRRYGLTIDNLLSAEIVLADGRQVTASADENPDLFWGIRGGGGNFGVVTTFVFQGQPVSTIVGGPTFWDVDRTPELLAAYREFMPAAARQLYGFFNFHFIPPAPIFPEELHLRPVCGIVWCWDGDDEEAAAKAMAPMLEVAEPVLHGVQAMPLPALNSAFDDLYAPGDQWYWRGDFVKEISDEAIARNIEFGGALPTIKSGSHIYPIDGAAHDVGPTDTPWAYRDANWSQVIVGVDPDPASATKLRDWVVAFHEALHPYSAGGAYVNFMMDEGQERVQATYRENYDRLAGVKATYDPENVFRVNQNILPKS
jgi:FAD/FMN-containing dehydrogenase